MSAKARPNRRDFLKHAAFVAAAAAGGCASTTPRGSGASRPNILWITAEDMNAHLGCYGDRVARTPNLDQFATEGVRYENAFATAPVCSPARSCLITGMYATSLGTHPLRCQMRIPSFVRGFPAYLREAGYFTSNNVKTDYNVADEKAFVADAWDRCDAKAHWRDRKPGQPFLSVFNIMTTHQSRTSVWPWQQFEKEVASQLRPEERTDPAKVILPPYYPDTQLARRTMARYYDCICAMDKQFAAILKQLEEDRLAENTIVFFYGDNGAGIPRHKRLPHDSGLHVPLIIRLPEQFRDLSPNRLGTATDRLVSFVDFAPTVLSLCDIKPPSHMQGQAFLGERTGRPREFIYGARDRVDEAYDLSRAVRDKRWMYIRNYVPHLSWAQPEGFSDQSEFRRQIVAMAKQGKLNAAQMTYAGPRKPVEELYDTQADPHQVNNLADRPEHRGILERMRREHRKWVLEMRDLGFMPEEQIAKRSAGTTPYEMAQDRKAYPLERIFEAAQQVGAGGRTNWSDSESAVRYWAVMGLRASESESSTAALHALLDDQSPSVRIEAASIVLSREADEKAMQVLTSSLAGADLDAVLYAARALELLGETARPALPIMKQALAKAESQGERDPYLFIQFALKAAIAGLAK